MALAVTTPPLREAVTSTAVDAIAVTASDSTADPNGPFFRLYTGQAGDIKLTTLAGNDVLLTAVPIGFVDVACTKVWSTGTAHASTIIGLK